MAANVNRHTHNFRKCSYASVGLAQVHPNYPHIVITSAPQDAFSDLRIRNSTFPAL